MWDVGIGVGLWNAMPKTRDKPGELRTPQKEIGNLWEEEQEQSLVRVSLNGDDGEGHPSPRLRQEEGW